MSERRASLLIASAVLLGGLAGLLLLPEEGYSFPEPLKTVDVGTTDLSERVIVAGEDFLSIKTVQGVPISRMSNLKWMRHLQAISLSS